MLIPIKSSNCYSKQQVYVYLQALDKPTTVIRPLLKAILVQHKMQHTLCFKKTGTLFISFIIHSNDDSYILSIYFELAFLQLHLAKILCKLIII